MRLVAQIKKKFPAELLSKNFKSNLREVMFRINHSNMKRGSLDLIQDTNLINNFNS